MNDLSGILVSVGALLTVLGGGVAWIAARMDAKDQAVKDLLTKQIKDLSDEIEGLHKQITTHQLQTAQREALFFRRIYDLENSIHDAGSDMPKTTGWPP